jgi:hypothetical protein
MVFLEVPWHGRAPTFSFANNPVFRDIQKKLAVNELSPREETS